MLALFALLPLALAAPASQRLTPRGAFSGEATFYGISDSSPHLYCGDYYTSEDEPIVALSMNGMMHQGQCHKWITVQYGDATVRAQVKDGCEDCAYGNVDLSPGAIKQLRPDALEAGRFAVKWWFDGDAPEGDNNAGNDDKPTPSITNDVLIASSTPTETTSTSTDDAAVETTTTSSTTSTATPTASPTASPIVDSTDDATTTTSPTLDTTSTTASPTLSSTSDALPTAAPTSTTSSTTPTTSTVIQGGKPVQCRRRRV